jgi:hypothetical protein
MQWNRLARWASAPLPVWPTSNSQKVTAGRKLCPPAESLEGSASALPKLIETPFLAFANRISGACAPAW